MQAKIIQSFLSPWGYYHLVSGLLKASGLGCEFRTICCCIWATRPPALSAVYLCGGQSELQLLLGHVAHLKVDGGTKEVQGHHGNLVHVSDSIADGKSASHHVCISNGFSLKTKEESGFVFFPREAGSEGMSVRPLVPDPALGPILGGVALRDLHPIQVLAFPQSPALVLSPPGNLPPLALFPIVTAFPSEIWRCRWPYSPNQGSKLVRQTAIHWWGKDHLSRLETWKITRIHQGQLILSNLENLHSM